MASTRFPSTRFHISGHRSSRLRRAVVALAPVLPVLASPAAFAQTAWLGTTNSDIFTGTNWTGGGVPTSTTPVTFGNVTSNRYAVSVNSTFFTPSVTFTGSVAYTFSGGSSLNIANSTSGNNSLAVSGTGGVTFNNQVTVLNPSTVAATGGNIAFQGPLVTALNAVAVFNVSTSRTVSVTGATSLQSGAGFRATGPGFFRYAPATGTSINSNSSFEAAGGTTLLDSPSSLLYNVSVTAAGATLIVSPNAYPGFFGNTTLSAGTLDVQRALTLNTLVASGGTVLNSSVGASGSITTQFLRNAVGPNTPQFNVPLSFPAATLNRNPSVTYDLDFNSPLTAPTTTYDTTAGASLRFSAGSASTSTTPAVFNGSATATTLSFDGGRIVAPGGSLQFNAGTLYLQAINAPRTLDATLNLSGGSLLPSPTAAYVLTVTNVFVGSSASATFNGSVIPGQLTNNGSVSFITSPGPSIATNYVFNYGTMTVGPSGITTPLLANFGSLSLATNASVNGTLNNFGPVRFANIGTNPDVVGSYIHQSNATLDFSTRNTFTVTSTLTSDGIFFNAPFTAPAGSNISAEQNASFSNTSLFTLNNSTISFRNGTFNNNTGTGTITGTGSIQCLNTSGPLTTFANDGFISPAPSSNIVLFGAMVLFNRSGTIQLDPNEQIYGAPINNASTINLAGGSIGLLAGVTNQASGLIQGFGNITGDFINSGLLRANSGTLRFTGNTVSNTGTIALENTQVLVSSPFANGGQMTLSGNSLLGGFGTLSNTGRISGSGQISVSVSNRAGGRIEPTGTLTLFFQPTLFSGSTLTLNTASTLSLPNGISGGLSQGLINLAGGTLDLTGFPLTNTFTGVISGFGNLTASSILNSGALTFAGGTSFINAPLTNDPGKTLRVQSATAIFNYPVSNNGIFRVTNGNAVFVSTFSSPSSLPSALSGGAALSPAVVSFAGNGTLNLTEGSYFESDGLLQSALSLAGQPSNPARLLIPSREPTGDISPTAGRLNPPALVRMNSLSVSAVSGQFTGLIDLVTNDLLLRSSNPSADLSLLRSLARAFITSGGAVGLGSSSALPNTRLAVIANSTTPAGTPYFSTFDTIPALPTDVLVRFTYVGDTNLDGVINGTDLANLIEGMSLPASQAGWQTGDFNYDGVVNTADLAEFYTARSAYLASPVSLGTPADFGPVVTGAVPEPTALAALLPAPLLFPRRRR